MGLIVRSLDWENLNEENIPKDCADVMNFFNDGLYRNRFPLIPRRNPITVDEIRTLWMPAKERNITIVGLDDSLDMHKVIGSGTLFVDESEKIGEYHLTINPNFIRRGMGEAITRKIISGAAERDLSIKIKTSIHNHAVQKGLAKMGYWPVGCALENEDYKNKISPPENSDLPLFATLHYLIN